MKKFFKDNNNNYSMMRLITLIITSAILGIYVISNIIMFVNVLINKTNIDIVDFKTNMCMVLIAVIGGKSIQSFSERNKK